MEIDLNRIAFTRSRQVTFKDSAFVQAKGKYPSVKKVCILSCCLLKKVSFL